MVNPATGRLVASIIVLIGAILLIAAVFIPWYYVQESGAGATLTQYSYPGLPSTNGTIQFTCSSYPAACPHQTSYSSADENNTGMIAETGYFLLIVGFVIGLIGAIFGVMSRGKASRASPAIWFSIIAMILAIVTPVLFAAALPAAVAKDTPSLARPTSSGPWSSFSGSATYTFHTISFTLTWGPSTGWYLSFGAFVILLVGLILFYRFRKELPAPAAAPTPTPPAPSGSPPAQ